MGSLYNLITKTNLKSPIILFPLIFPLILVLMYSVTIGDNLSEEEVNATISSIIVTVLALQTMQSGLMGFGFNFMNLKQSVLLKRVGATKISKWEVLGAVALYGLTIWLIAIVWVLLLVQFFSMIGLFYSIQTIGPDAGTNVVGSVQWNSFQWGKMIFATLIMVYLSYAIGLFFVSISKDDITFQAIVMLYFFSVGLLGGMMIPGVKPDWMIWIGYLIPHSYANELFQVAAGSITISNTEIAGEITISQGKIIADIIVPIFVGTLAIFGASKYLKFD